MPWVLPWTANRSLMSGLSVPEIQALSFHDPAPFRVDPANHPQRPEAMAANGAALAVYAGGSAMAA